MTGSIVSDAATIKAAAAQISNMMLDSEDGIAVDQCVDILEQKSSVANFVKSCFPGARASSQVLKEISTTIEKYGLDDDNTLFAESCCPDEINHDPSSLPSILASHLGEVFHLGGLGGVPFTGKTGFAAFSHHVPKDGHAFILMAPHIGVTDCMQLGKFGREGQTSFGAACGAAVGALGTCKGCRKAKKKLPNIMDDPSDYQMNFLTHEINKRYDSIVGSSNGGSSIAEANKIQATLATNVHSIGRKMLTDIVSLDFGDDDSTLVLLTGVQINMPRPFEDFFQPLSFQLRRKNGEVIDLLQDAFGISSHNSKSPKSQFNRSKFR